MVYMYPSEYITYGLTTTSNFATKLDGSAEYYIKDHLGSTRAVVASNGTITKQVDFEPFGGVLWEAGSANPTKGYIDKPKDKESGLHNMSMRFYEDESPRFTSIDPLWESFRAQSPYVYALNNPLVLKDPSGLGPDQSEPMLLDENGRGEAASSAMQRAANGKKGSGAKQEQRADIEKVELKPESELAAVGFQSGGTDVLPENWTIVK